MNKIEKSKEDKHCSMCKYYQCVNFFMYCTKLQHRIKASRKTVVNTLKAMNKREAKILALEVLAENVDILIESDRVSDAIRTPKDCDLINIAFGEIANELFMRAKRMKERTKKD